MNQILGCDWLLEQVRWRYLARSGLPSVSWEKKSVLFPYNKFFIDQACLVKVAGYWEWPHCFACLWMLTLSRSMNMRKKE